jgi:hypothetical protein
METIWVMVIAHVLNHGADVYANVKRTAYATAIECEAARPKGSASKCVEVELPRK